MMRLEPCRPGRPRDEYVPEVRRAQIPAAEACDLSSIPAFPSLGPRSSCPGTGTARRTGRAEASGIEETRGCGSPAFANRAAASPRATRSKHPPPRRRRGQRRGKTNHALPARLVPGRRHCARRRAQAIVQSTGCRPIPPRGAIDGENALGPTSVAAMRGRSPRRRPIATPRSSLISGEQDLRHDALAVLATQLHHDWDDLFEIGEHIGLRERYAACMTMRASHLRPRAGVCVNRRQRSGMPCIDRLQEGEGFRRHGARRAAIGPAACAGRFPAAIAHRLWRRSGLLGRQKTHAILVRWHKVRACLRSSRSSRFAAHPSGAHSGM